MKSSMTNQFWDDDTFTADTMIWVDPRMITIILRGLKNKMKCELEIDLNFYCKTYYSATKDDPGKGNTDESDEDMDPVELIVTDDTYDPTSLNSVLGRLPVFLSTKSMLEEIVSKSGHILLLSSKYHAEVAGQGIEYCFGRTKWWFKMNNTAQLQTKEAVKGAFGWEVVRIDHVRKFARKARDYQRVYRAGVTGLAAESSVKQCKTHRCMGDTNHTFITK